MVSITIAFLAGFLAGWFTRKHHAGVIHQVTEGASAGTAVLMDGDVVVSRRKVRGPQYEQLRHHGRGKPDAYVYVGRNDAGEYVMQKVTH